MEQTCRTCGWWKVLGNPDLARCCRHAPVVVDSSLDGRWPLTKADDTCGEYAWNGEVVLRRVDDGQ